MNKQLLEKLHKIKPQKVGTLPVVVLPLEDYERMKEDLEIYSSKGLTSRIAKARKDISAGKGLTLAEVKKRLKF
jgi:PHD/YefM family antitoxin component YafN of YafNO toxin-antitoxin module